MDEKQRAYLYDLVFNSEAGQMVLQDLIQHHYLCASTYREPGDSPELVAYREGGRNAVLRILKYAGLKLNFSKLEA